MKVSKDYISQLVGIIEEQRVEIYNLKNKVSKQEEIINKLLIEVKEL
jgi:hypothetical protein